MIPNSVDTLGVLKLVATALSLWRRAHFRTWRSLFVACARAREASCFRGPKSMQISWQAQHSVTGAVNRDFSTCGPFADFVASTALCEPRSADFVGAGFLTCAALCEPRSQDFVAGTALCAPRCSLALSLSLSLTLSLSLSHSHSHSLILSLSLFLTHTHSLTHSPTHPQSPPPSPRSPPSSPPSPLWTPMRLDFLLLHL